MMRRIRIALSGNPNSGKTTVFNAITGARQHIANYPGVTVEKKYGSVNHKGYEIEVVDLPVPRSVVEDWLVDGDLVGQAASLRANRLSILATQSAEQGKRLVV